MHGPRCMRRIQVNLSYLATLADRKTVQPPAPPQVLMPPLLNLGLKLRVSSDVTPEKLPDPNVDREERDRLLKNLYGKLQALFPGVDPKKEGPPSASNARPGGPGQNPNQPSMKAPNGQMMGSEHGSPAPGPQVQKTPQMSNATAPMMHA